MIISSILKSLTDALAKRNGDGVNIKFDTFSIKNRHSKSSCRIDETAKITGYQIINFVAEKILKEAKRNSNGATKNWYEYHRHNHISRIHT
jgi:nucleoid DNA-binding protein